MTLGNEISDKCDNYEMCHTVTQYKLVKLGNELDVTHCDTMQICDTKSLSIQCTL
jgi:hypothetical protein